MPNDPLIGVPVAQCLHGRLPSGVPIVHNKVNGVETATTPAHFVPVGSIIPGNLADLNAHGFLGEIAPWTTGQYIVTGDGKEAYWDNTAEVWKAGRAP